MQQFVKVFPLLVLFVETKSLQIIQCDPGLFYNPMLQACQVCQSCPDGQVVTVPCSTLTDTECAPFRFDNNVLPEHPESYDSEEYSYEELDSEESDSGTGPAGNKYKFCPLCDYIAHSYGPVHILYLAVPHALSLHYGLLIPSNYES